MKKIAVFNHKGGVSKYIDCYVHDFVRERMVGAFNNPAQMSDKTREYKVS